MAVQGACRAISTSWVLSFARAEASGDPYGFRLGLQRYILVSTGGGTQEAELDWDEALLSELLAIRQPNRDQEILQRLGEKLRQFLSKAGWAQYEANILAAVQEQRRVVLTLRSAAAEIYSLPWELITLKSTGQHVGELPGVLLRYEWPETMTAPAVTPPSASPLRVLFAWSAAGGAVPGAEQLAALRRACSEGARTGAVEHDVLAHASPRSLAETLEAGQREGRPFTILHLLCHGHATGATYGLALNGEDAGEIAAVDAGGLRRLLSPFVGMLRLVVLSACDSGNSGAPGNQLGSVAQALHRIGIAKVVASRYPLSVSGSIRLSEVLYRELLDGKSSLDEALLALRQELFRDNSHLDWASLQLYSRAADDTFRASDFLQAQPIVTRQIAAQEPLANNPKRSAHSPLIAVAVLVIFAAMGILALKVKRDAASRASLPPPPAQPLVISSVSKTPAPAVAPPAAIPVAPPAPAEVSPVSTRKSPVAAKAKAAPPALFTVIIRGDSGSSIRVAGHVRTAVIIKKGSHAQADFLLSAGTHRVTCTDAVTKVSQDVTIRVGAEEKNEADCFLP